jgi:hypothetical protein
VSHLLRAAGGSGDVARAKSSKQEEVLVSAHLLRAAGGLLLQVLVAVHLLRSAGGGFWW